MENEKTIRRIYTKSKRKRVDHCNICGEIQQLTYDHVPPQCCFNDINVRPVASFSGLEEKYNQFCSQNGVKYRSLCSACNSLTGKYDKAIEQFVTQIKLEISTNFTPSQPSIISVRINKFARAICGHFLAMCNEYNNENIVDINLRKYILNPELTPPKGYKLLCWFYPYTTVFTMRDVAALIPCSNPSIPKGMYSVLSAFPISFILCESTDDCGLLDIFSYCTNKIDEEISLPFDYRSALHPGTKQFRDVRWPCYISDDEFGVPGLICSKTAVDDSVFANRDVHKLKERLQR